MVLALMQSATPSRRNVTAALATAMAQFVSDVMGLKSDRRCAARMCQRMPELGTESVGLASLIAALDANYDKLF